MTDPKNNRDCPLNNKSNNNSEVDGCPWYINSPKHNNCFWEYVREKSEPDGSMQELTQAQIAELFGWSNTKAHFMLKQANVELVQALVKANANTLLNEDPSQSLDVNGFAIDIPTDYTSDDSEE